jgi:hypothetical protein
LFRWKDLSKTGAVAGSIGGMAIALVVWLAAAKATGGVITVETLSDQWVSFAGNAAAIVSGGVMSIGFSLWRPANFDWERTRQMATVEESDPYAGDETPTISKGLKGLDDETMPEYGIQPNTLQNKESVTTIDGLDLVALERTYKFYGYLFVGLALVITIVRCFKPSRRSSRCVLMLLNIRSYLYHWELRRTFSPHVSLAVLSAS